MQIRPKKWDTFQHYNDRSPPWIRLHRSLLDHREFNALSPFAAKLLVLLWLMASEKDAGVIEADAGAISFRARLPETEVERALNELMLAGFFEEVDGDPQAASGLVTNERNVLTSRHIPDRVKREVWARDEGKCRVCGVTEAIEFDHVVPVSKGGNSMAANLQLLCRPCNRRKRVRLAEQTATPTQPPLGQRTTETEVEAEVEGETETEADSAIAAADAATPFVLATSHARISPESKARAALWDTGVLVLVGSGMGAGAARTFLGRLVKEYGERLVGVAVRECAARPPANAREWLPARCQERRARSGNGAAAIEARNASAAAAWASDMGG